MADVRCESCGWEGDAKELYLPLSGSRPEDCRCPFCYDADQLVDLEDEPAPVEVRPDWKEDIGKLGDRFMRHGIPR